MLFQGLVGVTSKLKNGSVYNFIEDVFYQCVTQLGVGDISIVMRNLAYASVVLEFCIFIELNIIGFGMIFG